MHGKYLPALFVVLSIISVSYCHKYEQFPNNIMPLVTSCNPEEGCSAVDANAGDLVADPADCHKYFVCVTIGGELQPSDDSLSCPSGDYFNSTAGACELETTPCTLNCSSTCPTVCVDLYDIVGFPGDCSKYYICLLGGAKVEVDCPAETPYFDGGNCTTSEATCCDFCTPVCDAIGVQVPDPTDCHSYYICLAAGTPSNETLLPCASGEIFDPDLGGCVPGTTCEPICSSTSTSSGSTTTPIPSSTTPGLTSTQSTPTQGPSTSPTTQTQPSAPSTQSTTTHPTTTGDGCVSTYTCITDGNFPRCPYCDPTYVTCTGGTAQAKNCTGDKVFNTNSAFPVCLEPENCPYP